MSKNGMPEGISFDDDDQEPTPRLHHFEWFNEWAVKHRRQEDIAIQFGVQQGAISKGCKKVYEWRRKKKQEEIDEMQQRQLVTLEELAKENLQEWRASKKTEYCYEARAAMEDARRIIGAEAPKKQELSGEVTGLSTVLGSTREETIRAHLQAELERLNASSRES